jgi:hypothetical protein
MGPSPLRLVLALASVLLALPPGWCCVAPSPHPGPAPGRAPRSCCHGRRQAPAKRTPTHTPLPVPVNGSSCCCFDRAPAKPARPGNAHPERALPPSPALAPALPLVNAEGATVPPGLHVPSPPLQLLHCVWLC